MLNKQKIIQELSLWQTGAKGFYSGKGLVCPVCGRSDKFAVKFDDKRGGGYNCFHGSCGAKGSIFKYLKGIGRFDLLDKEHYVTIQSNIKSIFENTEEVIQLKEKSLPIGFKLILQDDYLDERGFLSHHYQSFKPGYTNIESKYQDSIIFQLFQEGKRVGYLSRSRKSKEWHKQNLEAYEQGEENLVLRYNNSPETDFGKILGGIDDVVLDTKTVIITEGLFDKVGVDNKLNLFSQRRIRCVFSFGNKFSDEQIALLRNKHIDNIILMYDAGTIKQMKNVSLRLSTEFNVKIAEITGKDDPGDMSLEVMQNILNNLQDPYYFYKNKLNSLKINF